jgi:site-specific recombinase XerD
MFLDNDGSIQALQHLLGHANIKSTEIYIETVRTKQALSEHMRASPVANMNRKKK